jgi:hypothetical protein
MPITSYEDAAFLIHRELEGQGEIGVMKMMFTMALCCHISTDTCKAPYKYRYCYENPHECLHDYFMWDGKGHPPGNWIVRKSGFDGDYKNPDYKPNL